LSCETDQGYDDSLLSQGVQACKGINDTGHATDSSVPAVTKTSSGIAVASSIPSQHSGTSHRIVAIDIFVGAIVLAVVVLGL